MTTIIHGDNGVVFPDSTTQGTALTTGNQTFTGVKTFASAPVLSAGATVGSATMAAPSGTAPLYVARAWASLSANSAANPTLNVSGNVASVTRSTTGQYAVTFTTAMPDASYSVQVNHGQLGMITMASTLTTTGFTIGAFVATTGAYADLATSIPFSFVVFR